MINELAYIVAIAFAVSFYFGIFPRATSSIIILKHIQKFIEKNTKKQPFDEKRPLLNTLNALFYRLTRITLLFNILASSVLFPLLGAIMIWLYRPSIMIYYLIFCIPYYLFALKTSEKSIDNFEETFFGSKSDGAYFIIFKPYTTAHFIDIVFRWIPLCLGILLLIILLV